MKKLVITTPFVSTNRLYGFAPDGRRFKTKKATITKDAIGWEAKAAFDGEPMDGELVVTVDLFFPDRRRRDLDNIKGLIDALTGIVWEDDSMIYDLHIRKFIDPKKPRIEILCNRRK